MSVTTEGPSRINARSPTTDLHWIVLLEIGVIKWSASALVRHPALT